MRYALLVLLAAACAPGADSPPAAQARRLQDLGDFCGAADAAKAWAKSAPLNPAAWVLYAEGAAYCGRREEALEALRRAGRLRSGPADDVAAYLYMHLGEPKLSLRASDRYLARLEGDAWHWLRRAQAASALGDAAALSAARSRAVEEAARSGCKGVLEGIRWNRAGYIAARLEDGLKAPARIAARRAAECAGEDEQGRRDADELLRLLE